MNYFVGNSLGVNLTGIEKAIINRLNLFKEMGDQRNVYFCHGIDIYIEMPKIILLVLTILICMISSKKQHI